MNEIYHNIEIICVCMLNLGTPKTATSAGVDANRRLNTPRQMIR